jgi:hypothetical protein
MITRDKRFYRELVFGGNIGNQNLGLSRAVNALSALQVRQRNENVISGIDLEYAGIHAGKSISEDLADCK